MQQKCSRSCGCSMLARVIAADAVVSVASVTTQYAARYVGASHNGNLSMVGQCLLSTCLLICAARHCMSQIAPATALGCNCMLSTAVTHNQSEQVGRPVTHPAQPQPRLEATLLAVAPGCFLKVCHGLFCAAAAAQLLHDCR
jgi:hypothetical protein